MRGDIRPGRADGHVRSMPGFGCASDRFRIHRSTQAIARKGKRGHSLDDYHALYAHGDHSSIAGALKHQLIDKHPEFARVDIGKQQSEERAAYTRRSGQLGGAPPPELRSVERGLTEIFQIHARCGSLRYDDYMPRNSSSVSLYISMRPKKITRTQNISDRAAATLAPTGASPSAGVAAALACRPL